MGSCISSCLPKTDTSSTLQTLNFLAAQNSNVDFTFLIEDTCSTCEPAPKRSFISRLFKKRKKCDKKPVLELVDNFLSPQTSPYSRLNESQRLPSTGSCTSRDIQLQYLDARALLARTTTSTPASSLDLEWEHETLPMTMSHDPSASASSWTALPDDLVQYSPQTTVPTHNSESDWSRISSSENSLEWDNVHNSIQVSPPPSELDTEFLLSEIERLTNQTLLETGQDLFS